MVEVVAATSTDYSFFLIATDAEEQLPTPVVTLRNYPNPFNPTTTIQFSCQDASCTELALLIFNARGQKVRTLHIDQAQLQQGCISWDGTDTAGKTVSSGLYFYRLLNGTKPMASSKMLLMK
jgi:flagellar hook assembly protein FlgD